MIFWKFLSTRPRFVNLDDLMAPIPFSCQLSGSLRRRNSLEQSRFSNSHCGGVVHRVFVLGPCFKSSESSKEVRPGLIEAFGLCFSCCYHERKAWYTDLFSSRRFFRPLSPIVISITTVRRHDVALPSISATVFTTPKPHGLTIVKLRVAYTRYPTGSTDRYSPAAIIKGNPFTQNHRCESSISIRARHYHCSCSSSS
jgi:hypothetical protein